MRALIGQSGRGREADALAGPSYNRDLPLQTKIHRVPLLPWQGAAEPLHEGECRVRDLAPAAVDGERVPAAWHLHELCHASIARLALVGGVRDCRGNGGIHDPNDPAYHYAIRCYTIGDLAETAVRSGNPVGMGLYMQQMETAARAPLRTAREAFDALGIVPWSDRARRQLRATGETSRPRTPSA
jgi:hypothetical protein